MRHTANIKKVLVVLSPDLIQPDKPQQSALIQRAVSLAKSTGCELELFHACYDGGLEQQLFESDADIERQRESLANRDATLLAEVAARLKDEGISVRYEARWDSPRTDAILRKIAQAEPDIVMKQAGEQSYLLGVTTNTDWELARRSPANLWLVSNKVDDIGRIVAAIGNKLGDPSDVTTAADYDILRAAGLLGDTFKASIYPVNAHQTPRASATVAGIAGMAVPVQPVEQLQQQQQHYDKLVEQHSGAVKALVQRFGIPRENVHTCKGAPDEVIPAVATKLDADMIVMGAHSISRLERVVSSVTVEPVIAEADCDILIVREHDLSGVPKAEKKSLQGVPEYDLAHAISNPEATFDSPLAVANMPEVSIELRKRILQAWEYDIRAEMSEENEGGPTKEIDVNALDAIVSARELLAMKSKKRGNDKTMSHGFTG